MDLDFTRWQQSTKCCWLHCWQSERDFTKGSWNVFWFDLGWHLVSCPMYHAQGEHANRNRESLRLTMQIILELLNDKLLDISSGVEHLPRRRPVTGLLPLRGADCWMQNAWVDFPFWIYKQIQCIFGCSSLALPHADLVELNWIEFKKPHEWLALWNIRLTTRISI